MHLFLFFYLKDQNFNIVKIDEVIFIKLLTKKNDLIGKLFDIILLVIFYGLCRN